MLLVLFLLVFTPYIAVLGTAVPVGYVAYAVAAFLFLVRGRISKESASNDLLLITCLTFSVYCVSIFLLHMLTSGQADMRLLRLAVDPIILILTARYVIVRLSLPSGALDAYRLVWLLTALLAVNSASIYLCFFSDGFRSVFYQIVVVNPKLFEYPIPRYGGFLYDGFSYSSTLMAMISIVCHSIYSRYGLRRRSLVILLVHLASIPSSMLAGRAGFLMLLAYFGVYTLLNLRVAIASLMRSPRPAFTGALLIMLSVGLVNWIYVADSRRSEVFRHSVRIYTDFVESGAFFDYTAQELTEHHYFIPDSAYALLFGEGYLFNWPAGMTRPDPGVTLGIFGFGVLGLSLLYLVLASPVLASIAAWRTAQGARLRLAPSPMAHAVAFAASFVALTFKDAYIFYPYPHFLLFFVFYYTVIGSSAGHRSLVTVSQRAAAPV